MSHPFDVLQLKNGARFIFTPCPGTQGFDLPASLLSLKQAGMDCLLTLLPEHEMHTLKVANIGEQLKQLDMQWFHLPIEDDCAPQEDFFAAFLPAKALLLDNIKQQQTLAIHCQGGTGRTGLMAAILLLELGYEQDEVLKAIRSVRPKALSKAAHLEFLNRQYGLDWHAAV